MRVLAANTKPTHHAMINTHMYTQAHLCYITFTLCIIVVVEQCTDGLLVVELCHLICCHPTLGETKEDKNHHYKVIHCH